MFLIFTLKEKVYLLNELQNEADPLGGNEGISLAVIQHYVIWLGIPLYGTRKVVKAYSISNEQFIPVLLCPEGMRTEADHMLPLVRSAWTKRLFMPIIGIAFLFFLGWLPFLVVPNNQRENRQAECRLNPQKGDIYVATVTKSYYTVGQIEKLVKLVYKVMYLELNHKKGLICL